METRQKRRWVITGSDEHRIAENKYLAETVAEKLQEGYQERRIRTFRWSPYHPWFRPDNLKPYSYVDIFDTEKIVASFREDPNFPRSKILIGQTNLREASEEFVKEVLKKLKIKREINLVDHLI